MMKVWRYMLPSILSIAYITICTYSCYYYFYILLLVVNILNVWWGEFRNDELAKVLTFFYRSSTAVYIKRINAIILTGMIVWGIWFVDRANFSGWHLVGFTITTGILTGCFIVSLAHDLLHSHSAIEKGLSIVLLTASGIPHFAADHMCGHHREIGLKSDVTTAPINQHFYGYFVKVIYARLINSYVLQYGLPVYLRKKILLSNVIMLLILATTWCAILYVSKHPAVTIFFFILQGFVSYLLYELTNYIQHYGLYRKNKMQAIDVALSWNCYYKYTNYILFLLPLHSLHHLPQQCRGNIIGNLKAAPRMPYLYFVMIIMALLPSLWFKKMNKLAVKYNQNANTNV